jgi:hypothetical protein
MLIHDRQTYREQRDAILGLLALLSTLWNRLLLLLLVLFRTKTVHRSRYTKGDLLISPSGSSKSLVVLSVHYVYPRLHPEEHSLSGTGVDIEYTVLTSEGLEQRVTEPYLRLWASQD